MSKYSNPFPQHFDSNGNPLAFYTVYFGEPNQDTKANPKAPFSDSALTTPIPTFHVLDNQGAYGSDIFLNGEYSIRIETPLGALWRESASVEGISSLLNLLTHNDGRYSATFGSVVSMVALTPTDGVIYTPVSGQSVYLTSYYPSIPFSEPQGGGGHFRVMTLAEYALTPDETGAAFTVGSFAFVRDFDEIVNVKDFGAAGDNVTDDTAAIQAGMDFLAASDFNGAAVLHVPSGIYRTSATINLKVGVILQGIGTPWSSIKVLDGVTGVDVITASFLTPGNDYIYIKGLDIHANKETGCNGRGIVFMQCHVPSFIEDCVVRHGTGNNIDINFCSVLNLNRVWSANAAGYALQVDSTRSLNVTGGAYENPTSGTAHIRIENTANVVLPQVSFNMLHLEGLLTNGIAGVEIGGGTNFDSGLGVNINGMQVLGKNGTPTNNPSFRLLNTRCTINLTGYSETGTSGFGEGFPSTAVVPADVNRAIAMWSFLGDATHSYGIVPAVFATEEGKTVELIVEGKTASSIAFGPTEINVLIPTQPDTDYNVLIGMNNYMGNNRTAYFDSATKTTAAFKIKFVDPTTGLPAQLSNPTDFTYSITRQA